MMMMMMMMMVWQLTRDNLELLGDTQEKHRKEIKKIRARWG